MNLNLPMPRFLKALFLRHVPGMIDCVEFEEFIHDYFADALPAVQKRVFDIHLAMCRECRDYLEAYRRTVEIGKSALADGDALPDDVPEDLIHAILEARKN